MKEEECSTLLLCLCVFMSQETTAEYINYFNKKRTLELFFTGIGSVQYLLCGKA